MKITSVEARDLSEAWFLCLRQVLTNGYEYTIERGSYSGQKRKELDMITVHIKNPGNRPLIPDVPPGVPAPSTMEYIDNYLPYLMTAHRAEGEQYTYGQYLEAQIAKVIKMYRETGFNTNQAFMTVGNPETLDLEDPPCLRSIDTRVRYGKLHFIIYFRSWDLWAGFPSNLAAIQLLKEYVAAEIGVEDGEIIAMSKGMHIYDYAWDIAKTAAGMNGV
ncbi:MULTISPECIES: thymidylate synthase [Dehalococcoides]|jgi:thymidylate synthase|uniref:thymidylate synthase n=1 Tax=Dehalococcoides TaxID=61434 RepID=UPI0002B76DE0|nr:MULTISPECIES: thymidylate synthase [Dehalococcoides]AGG06399.1 thymidylate synthase [Dehalococcoides mccartyi DCMB5]BAS31807.1 thymidylate synthase [Dehalococcoides mccartyi IBARAKI]